MPAKIYLPAILLAFVSFPARTNNIVINKKITVIGKAENSKANAVVVTDSANYFIDELYRWEEKYYGKTVKVTGILVTRTYEPVSTPEREVQELTGTVNYLKKAKWSLAE